MRRLASMVLAVSMLGIATMLLAQDRSQQDQHGFLGIMPVELDDTTARELGLETAAGVLIADVVPDGPAHRAGVRPRDVLRKIDDDTIDSRREMGNKLRTTTPGQVVVLTVIRNRQEKQIQVTLAQRPPPPPPPKQDLPN